MLFIHYLTFACTYNCCSVVPAITVCVLGGSGEQAGIGVSGKVTVNFGFPPFCFGRPVGHSKPTILIFFERETCSDQCIKFA
jgi:hypothetical protein